MCMHTFLLIVRSKAYEVMEWITKCWGRSSAKTTCTAVGAYWNTAISSVSNIIIIILLYKHTPDFLVLIHNKDIQSKHLIYMCKYIIVYAQMYVWSFSMCVTAHCFYICAGKWLDWSIICSGIWWISPHCLTWLNDFSVRALLMLLDNFSMNKNIVAHSASLLRIVLIRHGLVVSMLCMLAYSHCTLMQSLKVMSFTVNVLHTLPIGIIQQLICLLKSEFQKYVSMSS